MAATSGISVMSYIRGDRAATVQVEGGSMWGSTVQVTVGPRHTGIGAGMMVNSPPVNSLHDTPPVKAQPIERVRSEPLPASRR